MPMPNRSAPLSPAAQALGLGGDLQSQLMDEEEQRKKKLLRQARAMQQGALNPAVQSLFGGGLSV